MKRREVLAVVAVAVAMFTSGAVWLWGAIPLMAVGGLLLALMCLVDFKE